MNTLIEKLELQARQKDFDNVYTYLRDRLMWANLKKDPEILDECLDIMHTMRDTWKEVMKRTKNGSSGVA